jgi:hypothetical protein
MKTRGRHSSVSRSAVVSGGFNERAEPPKDLTERQNAIWREVVAGEDPSFFRTAVAKGLLADYCRRREAGEAIAEVIKRFSGDWDTDPVAMLRYDRLLRMRDRENNATFVLARALRLTNQSRYVPDTAARVAAKAVAEQDVPWRKSA